MLKASLLICLPLLGFSQREFKAKFDDCGEKILNSSSYYSLLCDDDDSVDIYI